MTIWTTVDRYGYSVYGLLIPYCLACGLTTCAVGIGLVLMVRFGPMPDRDVQDVLAAADIEALRVAREPDAHHNHLVRFKIQGSRGQRRPSMVVELQNGERGKKRRGNRARVRKHPDTYRQRWKRVIK